MVQRRSVGGSAHARAEEGMTAAASIQLKLFGPRARRRDSDEPGGAG